MPYNFVADSFHTNFLADILQVKCNFTPKTAVLRFQARLWGLGATYDDHLRLTAKHVVDFLLVLTELFSQAVFLVLRRGCSLGDGHSYCRCL